MKLSNKLKTIIFYIIITLLIPIYYFFAKNERTNLLKEHNIGSCVIDNIKTVGREQIISVKYHFNFENNLYHGESVYNRKEIKFENIKLLNNKSFPVIFKKRMYGMSSIILIFPKEFNDFSIPFPDSLKFVTQYICKEKN